jgi:hypothetical protein
MARLTKKAALHGGLLYWKKSPLPKNVLKKNLNLADRVARAGQHVERVGAR